MLLIEVLFHFRPFKDFKHYYLYGVCQQYRPYFGKVPSYQRFFALKKHLFMPLTLLLQSLKGEATGIYFADSTSLKVCHNKRIWSHQVFKSFSERGHTTMGWFYG